MSTLRKTILMDRSRRENSAEHSWHISLAILVLSEYADDRDIDLFRVMKMLLIHDLVEIDAGDTYCYDDEGRKDQRLREEKAAERPDMAGKQHKKPSGKITHEASQRRFHYPLELCEQPD